MLVLLGLTPGAAVAFILIVLAVTAAALVALVVVVAIVPGLGEDMRKAGDYLLGKDDNQLAPNSVRGLIIDNGRIDLQAREK